MAVRRDPDRTRARILDAATREFAAKGRAGARVDAIARRARVNKRMLYHYFGSKCGLFQAIVKRAAARNAEALAAMSDDPAEILPAWAESTGANRDWVRLLTWEALEMGEGRAPAAGAERRRNIEAATARLARGRARGLVAKDLDLGHLLLSISALAVFPWAFPQVARLMTGRGPDDPRFRSGRARFLRALARRLRG
jgi:AcrR family transcriptional regulator